MAKHHELDIYKECYKLLTEILHTIKHIRRDFKRTVGEDLRRIATDNINLIIKANATTIKETRLDYLMTLKDNLKTLRIILRSSKDTHIIPTKTYGRLILPLKEAIDQSEKWHNYTRKQLNTR